MQQHCFCQKKGWEGDGVKQFNLCNGLFLCLVSRATLIFFLLLDLLDAEDTQLWWSTQSYLMTRDCFLREYLMLMLSIIKGVHSKDKATIHTHHNKETFIQGLNIFRQLLQTSVCCPHRSFIVFQQHFCPIPKTCTSSFWFALWLKCKCGSTASTFIWTQMSFHEFGEEGILWMFHTFCTISFTEWERGNCAKWVMC